MNEKILEREIGYFLNHLASRLDGIILETPSHDPSQDSIANLKQIQKEMEIFLKAVKIGDKAFYP